MSQVVNIKGFDPDKEQEEFVFISNRQLKVIDEGAKTEIKNLSDTVLLLGGLINEIDENGLRSKRKNNKCFTGLISCNQSGYIGGLFYNSGTEACYIYSIEHILLSGDTAKIQYRSILDLDEILQALGGTAYGPKKVYNMNIQPTNDATSQLSVWGRLLGNIPIDDLEDYISDRVLFSSVLSSNTTKDTKDFKDDMIQLNPGMGFIIESSFTGSSFQGEIFIRWYED